MRFVGTGMFENVFATGQNLGCLDMASFMRFVGTGMFEDVFATGQKSSRDGTEVEL